MLKPYYDHAGITIYHGDCRELISETKPDSIITDPVWPGAKRQIPGRDAPYDLFDSVMRQLPPSLKRLAVQLGCNTNPNLLSSVPLELFRIAWLEYSCPGKYGRLLYTGDVGYLFGIPPKSKPGKHLIPGKVMHITNSEPRYDHPCPRALTQDHRHRTRRKILRDCSQKIGTGDSAIWCNQSGTNTGPPGKR
jgi:hypothetical protein